MARKRASLKDKGPETLGLTQKKGKGIDVLFGGPSEKPAEAENSDSAATPQAAAIESQPETPVTVENDLSALVEQTSVYPPPAPIAPPVMPASLPVNEADEDETDVTSSEAVVDELGLPVAMEAPPPDLELAMPVAEPAPEPISEAVPVTPPPPAPPVAAAPPSPPPSPPVSEVTPVAAPPTPPPSAAEAAPSAPLPTTPAELDVDESDGLSDLAAEDDLSGLEDDLSGLAGEAETTLESTTIPPANLPPGPPTRTAAPISPRIPGAYTPPGPASPAPTPYTYTPPTPTTTYTARPSTLGTPPSTATGAPDLSMPRARIESFGGIVSEEIEVEEKDILPEDSQLGESSSVLELKQRTQVEEDEEAARRVTRYIGRERREKLDQDIEELYNAVATELSVNKEDSEFALKVLSQAQDIIFEDTRQYDEALYLVAVVRTMIARKRNLRSWSYTWGSFVFFYALVWLVAFIAGFVADVQLQRLLTETNAQVDAIRAAWFAALAGGIGGVIGILYSLYWHVAMKQDFDRQYVMYYMVQPIMGFVLGAVVYFIIGSGFLVVNLVIDQSANTGEILTSPTVVAIQVVFGWIAGFRQRFVFEMIDKIVQRVSPKPEGDDEAKKPVSAIQAEERERIEARMEEREKAAGTAPPAESEMTADATAPSEG